MTILVDVALGLGEPRILLFFLFLFFCFMFHVLFSCIVFIFPVLFHAYKVLSLPELILYEEWTRKAIMLFILHTKLFKAL